MTQKQKIVEAPPLGTVLGDGYELRRFLGAGGVGAVYEARGPDDERVAVKVLLEAAVGAGDRAPATRFKRESSITSEIKSPHIVPTLATGLDDELRVLFMVMPLLVGLDLDQQVERSGPLHPAVAARIVRQACAALEVAHSAGVVHRDIKPANIFLEHDPAGKITVRLLDFGLAKWRREDTAVTATDCLLGTPHFMAPEQIKSASGADHRSDIYSLGASLYYSLCGATPFERAGSLGAVLTSVITKPAPLLQDNAPWIAPDLAAVVHGTLLRDKEARCPSAQELAAALEPFTEGTDELSAGMLQPLTLEHLEHHADTAQLPASWLHLTGSPPASERTFEITQLDDDPLIGTTIAKRYSVLRSLGSGGMGTVYETVAAGGDRVALKVLAAKAAGKGSAERRFVREARAVKAISSPHVVQVHEVDTDPELQLPFIAMELLIGSDLATLIKRHGALPPAVAARLFIQACRGLSAAHAEGFVHRDIKPANLFVHVQPQGECVVKICDFGIVKRLHGEWDDSVSLTQTQGVIGSPAYMSPEQAMSARSIDLRTDIWSLGVSLFQALSGAHPWTKRSTISEMLVAICTEPIPLLQDQAPWIAPELAVVVHRAMTRRLDDRFQSMAELAEALEPFTEGTPEVRREQLRAVSQTVRSEVKPRASGIVRGGGVSSDATLADSSVDSVRTSGSLSGATGEAMSQSMSRAPQRSRLGSRAALGAVAAAGLAAGAFFLLREPADEPAVPTDQPAVSAASAATRGAAISEHRVAVAISPTGAEVYVDDQPMQLEADGKLHLSGRPGTSFRVVLALDGHRLERRVFITDKGQADPGRLVLDRAPPSSASAASSAETAPDKPVAPRPRATQEPKPAPTAKPAPTTAPKATSQPTAPPTSTKPEIHKDW